MSSASSSPMIVTTPVPGSRSTVAAALADAGSCTALSAAITRQRRTTLMGPSSSNQRCRCKRSERGCIMDRDMHRPTDHAAGTDDPICPAEPAPGETARSPWWLPVGHHYDLHVEHRSLEHAGPFTGGGNKLVWH